ncbi:septin-7-like isoform X3 [Amphibalanus amphitrite]|uniref:septin-7-like isoform X3 n=1 Tax=Amphibalanus amphitrite TaxID=1232801 RepID=UPI001C9154B1|nr:septin-7-like isoform X3 [Amphibalanus amphitrite]
MTEPNKDSAPAAAATGATSFKTSFSTFKAASEDGERRQRRVEFSDKTKTEDGGSSVRKFSALPRYGGTSFSGSERSSGYQGPSYRLASMDRLANRHKLYETGSGDTNGTAENGPEPPRVVSATASITTTAALQSKREMFYKGESATAGRDSGAANLAAAAPAAGPGAPVTARDGREARDNRPQVAPKPDSAPAPSPKEPPPAPPKTVLSRSSAPPPPRRSDSEVTPARPGRPEEPPLVRPNKADDQNRERQARERSRRQLDGYVGFADLPNQVHRRAVKKGFHFTLMVVGESGLGKSTLVNSMFMSDIYNKEYPGPSHRIKKTVAVEKTIVKLTENSVNLNLTVVDTPGFGDAVDNSNCWQPVIEYIESRYEEYLNAESRVYRTEVVDTRVHCCLHFLAPSGHGLKPLDVEFMKRLHDKVNIVPVIAKADTMTPEEVIRFKKQILNEIAQHKIRIYEFPDCPTDEDSGLQRAMRQRVPFAVVGANTVLEVDGQKVRGRRYPWGVVQIENMEHSDFIPLRNMLIRTHMMDLRDVTNAVHYENFRCKRLAGLGTDGKPAKIVNKNPIAQMEEEKREHELKVKKMEAEMEQVFEMKVKEKKNKLKESEADLARREEQMLAPLEEQRRELEQEKAAFQREKEEWERLNGITLDQLRRRELESNSKETVDGKKKKKGLF